MLRIWVLVITITIGLPAYAKEFDARFFGAADIGMGVDLLNPQSRGICVIPGASRPGMGDTSGATASYAEFIESYDSLLGPVDKVDSQISRSMIQDWLLGGGFGSRRPDGFGMADH